MERQAADSVLKGDTASLKKLLADDFIGIGPNGGMKTKSELLDWAESRKIVRESIETSDIRVRMYGEIAVVTGTGKIKAHKEHKDISIHYRYTRVWIKKQGRWQIASFQATRIVEPRPALTPSPQGSCP
jgi:ketosteroid isomerase-like protein